MNQGDAIAAAVLETFDRLPANRKPAVRTNGVREWVPLSGIVAETKDGDFVCLALATGMKCLPAAKMPSARGIGLHDWHAEVLALRAFNRFVLQECRDVLGGGESPYVQWRETGGGGGGDGEEDSSEEDSSSAGPAFEWRPEVALHMYCSEAPCGDASMELTMAAQEDASPWAVPAEEGAEAAGAAGAAATAQEGAGAEGPAPARMLAGRAYFSRLGAVRRKPGRGDAPPTLSKSCSDKLALRQCTTLLGGLASLVVAPGPRVCLRSVVLPQSQYAAAGCRRCFSGAAPGTGGRMAPVAGRPWPGGYAFTPFAVQTTRVEFAYSKRGAMHAVHAKTSAAAPASSNLAVAWTCNGVNECLVGGVLRGRRALDPAGASAVSRRQLWALARQIADELPAQPRAQAQAQAQALQRVLRAATYADVKASARLAARARVKADVTALALPGWAKNEGDADWGLDT